MAKIILMADGAVLQEMTLSKERITIGRRPSNDIVIDNLAISGQHAAIITIQEDSFLEDLGSTNGTQVNGQPVKKHFLQNGDVIEMAKYRIKYQTEPQRGNSAANYSDATDTINTLTQVIQDTQNTQVYNPSEVYDDNIRPASLKILSGTSSGKEMHITKAITTIGRPGIQVAVITRNAQGYAITHIEGDSRPIVNGQAIGSAAQTLQDGDVFDLAGIEMQFSLK
ncbi:MAG: FHA domain-containing protein [Glaciimonas sp.]|nr:FHA domain-containing protein [Glaciimonas sp.]